MILLLPLPISKLLPQSFFQSSFPLLISKLLPLSISKFSSLTPPSYSLAFQSVCKSWCSKGRVLSYRTMRLVLILLVYGGVGDDATTVQIPTQWNGMGDGSKDQTQLILNWQTHTSLDRITAMLPTMLQAHDVIHSHTSGSAGFTDWNSAQPPMPTYYPEHFLAERWSAPAQHTHVLQFLVLRSNQETQCQLPQTMFDAMPAVNWLAGHTCKQTCIHICHTDTVQRVGPHWAWDSSLLYTLAVTHQYAAPTTPRKPPVPYKKTSHWQSVHIRGNALNPWSKSTY